MTFFDDRAIANMVKIIAGGRWKAGATPVDASLIRIELETWAQNFSENLKAEGQEREQDKNVKGDLQAFASLCSKASEVLTKLSISSALTGATIARTYLAAEVSGAEVIEDKTLEAATNLEALREACEGVAASLGALIKPARKAAVIETRAGKPPEGEKLAAVKGLMLIFETHSAARAGRTVEKEGARGAFNDFLRTAFRAMGVKGSVDEWAKTAIRFRDHGGKGKK
jgi:hypothetical protein